MSICSWDTLEVKNKKQNKKSAKKIISKIEAKYQQLYFIHYSCQNLGDDNEGYSPRITSIAILHSASSQMYSFSIHIVAEELHIMRDSIEDNFDKIEMEMLDRYFNFISERSDSIWIHWNMTNINFGFEAIEHRYKVLTGKNPITIDEKNKFNLSSLLKKRFGKNYANDPKMQSLMELNNEKSRSFLTGAEEVSAFKAKEYVKMHNSTMSKVYFFRNYNKDFETDSPIVTVLASAAPARTRANYGSRLKSVVILT
jgi:hypothetical protein